MKYRLLPRAPRRGVAGKTTVIMVEGTIMGPEKAITVVGESIIIEEEIVMEGAAETPWKPGSCSTPPIVPARRGEGSINMRWLIVVSAFGEEKQFSDHHVL